MYLFQTPGAAIGPRDKLQHSSPAGAGGNGESGRLSPSAPLIQGEEWWRWSGVWIRNGLKLHIVTLACDKIQVYTRIMVYNDLREIGLVMAGH